MDSLRTLSPSLARRLAITCQRLSGPRLAAGMDGIHEIVRDLGCLQLDPIGVVARSHLLVLWSRLGAYDPAQLDRLLWQERRLFEYWAHCASVVLTEDYPIHSLMMRGRSKGESAWVKRQRAWLTANAGLHRRVLREIRRRGPLLSRHFTDDADSDWRSTGWTSGRNISQMLDHLWLAGRLMVSGRVGGQKLWDLAERCLPEWTPRERLTPREVVRQAAQKSLRALGVATPQQIRGHFIRGRYPGLDAVLRELEAEGRIQRVQIREGKRGEPWPSPWYVHADDLPRLERLAAGEWQPRTTLLSPFDNLICDRRRTEQLFDFDFRMEIYVPKAQRKYGYYVLPILHGDRLIGRVDPEMDRTQGRLRIHAVHAEPDAPASKTVARAVARAIEDLGEFLGARAIEYSARVPEGWRSVMRLPWRARPNTV